LPAYTHTHTHTHTHKHKHKQTHKKRQWRIEPRRILLAPRKKWFSFRFCSTLQLTFFCFSFPFSPQKPFNTSSDPSLCRERRGGNRPSRRRASGQPRPSSYPKNQEGADGVLASSVPKRKRSGGKRNNNKNKISSTSRRERMSTGQYVERMRCPILHSPEVLPP
jgi:hypothetical protein